MVVGRADCLFEMVFVGMAIFNDGVFYDGVFYDGVLDGVLCCVMLS